MPTNNGNIDGFSGSKEQWKAMVDKICADDDYAYYFFHEKCRPLFSNILWKIYGNNADYDELINELFLLLKSPGSSGEMWHALKTYDYRTSLFDWIKTVAVRHFYTSSSDALNIPYSIIESGIAKEMFSELQKAIYRKFMCFRYIEGLDDEAIATKLEMDKSMLPALSRNAIKQLKTIVEHQYPEYYSVLFSKRGREEVSLEEYSEAPTNTEEDRQNARLDVYRYLDAMPNETYRKVIMALFLDDVPPEELAKEMDTPVSNIYNIKSRGLDQLRDIALYSNEICNLEKYIKLVSDDRNRYILSSIFIEKKDYDVVCSKLKITEVQFKKYKKDAIKELKNKIFKRKS